jgi:hypothetical protein
MRYKATFVAGLAAGYVLGSRAGRQRYEQIKRLSRTVSENPAVKRTTGLVQAQATQLGTQARRLVQDRAGLVGHDLAHKVTSRFGHHEIDLDGEHTYANGSMT